MDICDYIYLDNNATTQMRPETVAAMASWCNRGNPSAGYPAARAARDMMTGLRRELGRLCGVDVCCEEPRDTSAAMGHADPQRQQNARQNDSYKVIFTSGASEANCFVVRGAVEAYRLAAVSAGGPPVPHVVYSAIEHKSIINCVDQLVAAGLCTATSVRPADCVVLAEDVAAAIRGNTCLVCVMSTNNETGVQMDTVAIAGVCHRASVPFHCDTVQSFGKYPPRLDSADSPDSVSVSFHKFGGPPGVGALIVRGRFLTGWGLSPLIAGTQNEGLRGGTENLPGLGASLIACEINFRDRATKNFRLAQLKMMFWRRLSDAFPTMFVSDYLTAGIKGVRGRTVVLIAPSGRGETSRQGRVASTRDRKGPLPTSPSTLMISIVDPAAQPCNVKMKQWLQSRGIIVAVGSACNTASEKASHVLYAIGADRNLKKGALRISFGDDNTADEVGRAADVFAKMLQ